MPATHPLSDRELLERFRDRYPGVGSVHDIAATAEAEFVDAHAASLAGGEPEARRVHHMARCVSETTALVWANLRDLAVPHLRPTLFNNVSQRFLEQAGDIPGYQALFGDLSVLDCDESRSVFGPAAYFVDLMRFVEQHITEQATSAQERLDYRRPDLAHLSLDAGNTYGLLPEIELVNEALTSLVTSSDTSLDEVLRDSRYPWRLPFDEPRERVRVDLATMGTSLDEVYRVFGREPATATARVCEALGISAAEFDLLVASPAAPDAVTAAYGVEDIAALGAVDVFLNRTGLTRSELTDVVVGALDDVESAAGLDRHRFINDVGDGAGSITIEADVTDPQHPIERLVSLTAAKLDRIERYVRLARRLDWSFTDLDLALGSLQRDGGTTTVLEFDGVNDHLVVPEAPALAADIMTIECWVRPNEHRLNPILAKGSGGPGAATSDFLVWIDADGRLAVQAGAATGYSRSGRTIPLRSFTHVAVTIGGGARPVVGFVINGQPDATWRVEGGTESLDPALHGSIGNTGSRVLIGRSFGGHGFAGAICDVRVWDGARSPDEISAGRFVRRRGDEMGLLAYWPLVPERWGRISDRALDGRPAIVDDGGSSTQPRWAEHDLALGSLPPLVPPLFRFKGEDQLAASGASGLESDSFTFELVVAQGTNRAAPLLWWQGTGGERFGLSLDADGHLVLGSGPLAVTSTTALDRGRPTHVAVGVDGGSVSFFVDGVPEDAQRNPGVRLGEGPHRVWVGYDGSDRHFDGELGELRLWNVLRTEEQIDAGRFHTVPEAAPGLVGSWPLGAVDENRVRDRTFNGNHLWLGGEPATYRPEPAAAEAILPDTPVALEETLLHLDGDNDVVVLGEGDLALGNLDRFTVGLWFRADDPTAVEPQLLLSQGDAEAGLSVSLAAGTLTVVAWNAGLRGLPVVELTAAASVDATWHHVAVTMREGPDVADPACDALDQSELTAYLDGVELQRHVVPRLRLSPVGPTYFGGLGNMATTRVPGTFLISDGPLRACFGGFLADFQLWNRVLTTREIQRSRLAAPLPNAEGLLVHLPMNDAAGHELFDSQPDPSRVASLSRDDIALSGSSDPVANGDAFAHVTVAGSAEWAGYRFSGRIRMESSETQAGVTFSSRHGERRDQCYALVVDAAGGSFRIVSRPEDLSALEGELDTGIVPEPGAWYRFAIDLGDIGDATTIDVRLWLEGEPKPATAAASAVDSGPYRLKAGTVGVWRRGSGGCDVDDIAVGPATEESWLDESFERAWPGEPGSVPEGWSATHVVTVEEAGDGFIVHEHAGAFVLGTVFDVPIDQVLTTQHSAPGSEEWADYVFTGRFWIGDARVALGMTFLEADGPGYRIRRLPHRPMMQLDTERHDEELDGVLDSVYDPAPGTWQRFLVEVGSGETTTEIRAKFWSDGDPEPNEFSIEASDSSSSRSTRGTVGLWTVGAGERFVDDLLVFSRALAGSEHESPRFAEDFEGHAVGAAPDGWSDTGPNSDAAPAEIFVVADDGANQVLRTTATARNAHTHLTAVDTLDWGNYVFTGRMFIGAETGGLGVTFLSRYPEIEFVDRRDERAWGDGGMLRPHDRYYRFGRSPRIGTFRMWAHPDRNDKAKKRGRTDHERWPLRLEGSLDSGVTCELGTWYRFRIQVEDTGTATHILAKIWKDGGNEPETDQIDVVDASEYRLTSGGIGVRVSGRGVRMVDDLAVRPIAWLDATFDEAAVGAGVDGWNDRVSVPQHDPAPTLFATRNTRGNPAQWVAVADAPVIRNPAGTQVLRFDGAHQHAGNRVRRLDLSALTLEAWVRADDSTRAGSVVMLGSGANALDVGLQPGAVPSLRGAVELTGSAPIGTGWHHIAVTVGEGVATLVVDGVESGRTDHAVPDRLRRSSVTVGGAPAGAGGFSGAMSDIRLWRVARSAEAIASARFHDVEPAATDLVAAWIGPIEDGVVVRDRTENGRDLLLGGPAGSREPDAVPAVWDPVGAAGLAPSHILTFAEAGHGLGFDLGEPPAQVVQRTIEVWFLSRDVAVDRRKQLLYQGGDDIEGLSVYLHDGRLYVGGWGRVADADLGEEAWAGSWIATDRVDSGRWHHVALVLDGRRELRPGSLVAYLDGRPIDAASGTQLRQLGGAGGLGGVPGPVRFHDGRGDGSDNWLWGALMDVRIWDVARTSAEIASGWLAEPADPQGLALWWQFDVGVVDRTGSGGVTDADVTDRVVNNLVERPERSGPQPMDGVRLGQLAAIASLRDRTGMPVDRLVAMWSELPHRGRRSGAPLFDRLFNAGQSPHWDPAGSAASQWDVASEEDPERDRRVRGRLMAALRLSSEALDRAAAQTFADDSAVELDVGALSRLYRTVAIGRLLRVDGGDVATLLAAGGVGSIDDPTDLAAVLRLVDHLEAHEIPLQHYLAIVRGDTSPWAVGATGFAELLESMAGRAAGSLVGAAELGAIPGDESSGMRWLGALEEAGLIESGLVTGRIGDGTVLADVANRLELDGAHHAALADLLTSHRSLAVDAVVVSLAEFLDVDEARAAAGVAAPPGLDESVDVVVSLLGAATAPDGDHAPLIEIVDRLAFVFGLADVLRLGPEEALTLVSQPERIGIGDLTTPEPADVEQLLRVRALRESVGDAPALAGLLEGDFPSDRDIAAAWGRRSSEVAVVRNALIPDPAAVQNRIAALARLLAAMALATRIGADPGLLVRVADVEAGVDRGIAAAISDVRHARRDESGKGAKAVHDELTVRLRDALLVLATRNVSAFFEARDSGDVLSEYLLMDVKVGSEVLTSRLVAAIAAVQLYVQRCLLNLEEGVTLSATAAKQWEWMKNYRVWEANRKVFLYPESYIEPELRDTKTPQFEELEQQLLQSEVTEDSVETALGSYLSSLVELADLKIVGSYRHKPDGDDRDDVLHLVGRTRAKPWRFFTRQVTNTKLWGPWEPISLTIDSEFAAPVHAFGRLFVFWSEFSKLTESIDRIVPYWIYWFDPTRTPYPDVSPGGATQQEFDDVVAKRKQLVPLAPIPGQPLRAYLISETTGERVQENVDYYRPSIKFAYREFDGTWSAPQSIDDVADKISEGDHLQPEWQRVAVQRSLELLPAQTYTPPEERLVPDVLQVSKPTSLMRGTTVDSTTEMTWSLCLRVDESLAPSAVNGSVEDADLERHELPLIAYGQASPFAIGLRNRFRRIPGIPHVPDLLRELEAKTSAQRSAEETVAQRKAELGKAKKDDAKAAAEAALAAAKKALEKAKRATGDAEDALETAKKKPQWESAVDVVVGFGNGEMVAALSYETWRHVAVVLRHNGSSYEAQLLVDGSVVDTQTLAGDALAVADQVVIGRLDAAVEAAFVVFASELRIWDRARSAATIGAQMSLRMTGKEPGLFHMPLDKALPGAEMDIVAGTGLHLVKVRPPIAEIAPSKERIVMFCGETRRLIESNLGDGGIDLRLDTSAGAQSYDLDLSVSTSNSTRALSLHVIETTGVSLNDYVSEGSSTLNRYTPQGLQQLLALIPYLPPWFRPWFEARVRAMFREPQPTHRVLDALPPAEASLLDVGNQPGWYILDTGDESYLLQATTGSGELLDLMTATERLEYRYESANTKAERQPVSLRFKDDPVLVAQNRIPSFAFTRLTSHAPYDLQRRLFTGGVGDLLGTASQVSREKKLSEYGPVEDKVSLKPPDQVDFDGAHGIYYWELFFHVPFLIANTLNAEQDFAGAQRWYHFIFDPTAETQQSEEHWRYLPFRDDPLPKLADLLEPASPALAAYRDDPFDPHAIAALRASAYPKAILIKYIENLLDWADSLFSRDTGESVREAVQLYLLAFNLLGPRPVERGSGTFGGVGDYETIKAAFPDPAPRRFARDVRHAFRALPPSADGLPDFLTDYVFEPQSSGVGVSVGLVDNGNILTTFCVPENAALLGLWDRVEDRLHKIRHSLNIEGVARQLALFEPPLDPAQLVQAVAGGVGVAGAVAAGSVAVPHYRYGTMLGVAKDLAESVAGLGSALASALESRDGEHLAAMVLGHERELLNMATAVKDAEIEAARKSLEALKISKRAIESRRNRYAALVEEGLSPAETAELLLEAGAGVVRSTTGVLKALEGILGALPEVQTGGSGFGGSPVLTAGFGAQTYSSGVTAAIGVADVVADVLDLTAGLIGKRGGYQRRAAEWDHELAIAGLDLEEMDHQMAVAQIGIENAQRALAQHKREIEHNQEVAEFHRRKFSNQELYNWMAGRLSGLHFQAYRLAHAAAKSAERALQYELPTNETFISFGTWDGMRRGLLAGESLLLELQRMEAYHLSQDSRFLEIEKSVRLSELAPGQLALLRTRGSCTFELPELLFDMDHPGHYFRVIKTIEISIKAPVGAEDTINASLVQLGSKALLDPDITAVRYLLGDPSAEQPGGEVLRTDWRANQQIAISHVDRDDGMFVLDFFRDDRYFPFEGTGAVSTWELEMDPDANPGVDFDAIEEVVIHLRYTAKSDRGDFRSAVKREVARAQNG